MWQLNANDSEFNKIITFTSQENPKKVIFIVLL